MTWVTTTARMPKCLGFFATKKEVKNLEWLFDDYAICFETQSTRSFTDQWIDTWELVMPSWPRGTDWKPGEPGKPWKDWEDGKPGEPWLPWEPGKPGKDGEDWKPGKNWAPWKDWEPGEPWLPWEPGKQGPMMTVKDLSSEDFWLLVNALIEPLKPFLPSWPRWKQGEPWEPGKPGIPWEPGKQGEKITVTELVDEEFIQNIIKRIQPYLPRWQKWDTFKFQDLTPEDMKVLQASFQIMIDSAVANKLNK